MSASYNDPKRTNLSQKAEAGNVAPVGEPIRINGHAQVLEMLEVADPEFRASLLKRLAVRDPILAATLKKDLQEQGLM